MSIAEAVIYIVKDNPVSQGTLHLAKSVLSTATGWLPAPKHTPLTPMAPPPLILPQLFKIAAHSSIFLRLAGVSGATAVGLGAYGAHSILNEDGNEHRKRVFETANKYHFYHTVALLGVPLCHYPFISGILLTAGMCLFCGPCYYMSITGKDSMRKLTPFGGVCLIFGWLSFVL